MCTWNTGISIAFSLKQVHSKLKEHWYPEEESCWEKGENVYMQMSHLGPCHGKQGSSYLLVGGGHGAVI